MQMTANAIGRPVVAGPVEGTAIGNIMMQARAAGLVDGLASIRRIIADSIEMRRYDRLMRLWDAAYARFLQATSDPNAAEAH
jgi:rhamnulokinase